ncbi:hypothetical protein QT20_00140, partial [Staphylococcus aureus]
IQESGIESGGEASAILELGRHRSRANHGDAHALRRQLTAQCFREREHIGLAGVVHGHAGSRQERGDRAEIEDTAAVADQLIGEAQRQVGQRADVDIDHVELVGAIACHREAEQAETGIVHQVFDLDPGLGQGLCDPVAGVGLLEVAGNDDRR